MHIPQTFVTFDIILCDKWKLFRFPFIQQNNNNKKKSLLEELIMNMTFEKKRRKIFFFNLAFGIYYDFLQ